MISHNKLDQVFGPVGTSAGIVIFVAGLIETYYNLSGLILVFIGAFFGFSSSGTLIDFDKKRLKNTTNLFGFIRTGQWIWINSDMKITVKKSNKTWRAYSWSNRRIEIDDQDYRLILSAANGKEISEVKKTDNLDSARQEADQISKQLGLMQTR